MFEPGRRAQLSTSVLELVSSRFTRILSCAYAYACVVRVNQPYVSVRGVLVLFLSDPVLLLLFLSL